MNLLVSRSIRGHWPVCLVLAVVLLVTAGLAQADNTWGIGSPGNDTNWNAKQPLGATGTAANGNTAFVVQMKDHTGVIQSSANGTSIGTRAFTWGASLPVPLDANNNKTWLVNPNGNDSNPYECCGRQQHCQNDQQHQLPIDPHEDAMALPAFLATLAPAFGGLKRAFRLPCLAAATLLAAAAGCGGEQPARVSYAQPPPAGTPTLLGGSDFGWPAAGEEPSKLSLDRRSARQDEPIVVEGRIHAPGRDELGFVVVLFYGPLGGQSHVAVTNALGNCEKEGEGWFKYRAECPAPGRGSMHCKVEIHDAGGHVLAKGEIELE